jgi:hypothetical protein
LITGQVALRANSTLSFAYTVTSSTTPGKRRRPRRCGNFVKLLEVRSSHTGKHERDEGGGEEESSDDDEGDADDPQMTKTMDGGGAKRRWKKMAEISE